MKKHLLISTTLFLLVLFGNFSYAAINGNSLDFTKAQEQLNNIDQIGLNAASLNQIDLLLEQVKPYLDQGKTCVSTTQQELEQTEKALVALGEKVADEPKDITRERNGLLLLKSSAEARIAQCRLMTIRASEVEQKLQNNKKQTFTRDLFLRGPDISKIFLDPKIRSLDWLQASNDFFITEGGFASLSTWNIFSITLLTGIGLFFGYRIEALFAQHVLKIQQDGFIADFLRIIANRRKIFQLLGCLVGLSLALKLFMPVLEPPPYLPTAVNSLLLALTLSIFGKAYMLTLADPGQEDKAQMPIPQTGLFRLHLLAFLTGILWFVVTSRLATVLPDAVFYLIRALIVTLWYGILLWLFWFACNYLSRLQTWRGPVRFILTLMLGTVTLAELSGYRNLATHILVGTAGSLALILALGFGKYLANEILGGLGRGRYPWQQRLRQQFGIKQNEVVKGIIWTNSLLKLVLVIAFTYGLLSLWGISRVYASAFYEWLIDGFTIGKINIVPSRVGVGLLIMAIGWTAVSLVKDKVVRRWLADSELALSVQDALSTVFGYIGFSIVILIGLSAAGIDFSGLAMVAGALSVGIGFGLQNIVNNFVSGLILLFERPIKRGDWIVVGTTEGYVKKVSVRSTIIQTFDRSDVIVPNSELISSQVTNMMLLDMKGRVRVPVGVAYGSNTELVKQLLLEVAHNHPEVITNGTSPLPAVRFQAFGGSSLEFELVCHLKNVDKRIDVRSDMHFSIDNSFREHDIQIPFPQHDIHIKSGLHKEERQGVSVQE